MLDVEMLQANGARLLLQQVEPAVSKRLKSFPVSVVR